jgi:BASS family bile acid:Na+ symporter
VTLANKLSRIGNLGQKHLLPLVLAAYTAAAVWPTPGLEAKQFVVTQVGARTVTVPMAFLAVLLFNASIGASATELGAVARRPATLLAGVAVNVLIPITFLFAVRTWLLAWPNAEEANCLLLGLTVVASMPVAGSSTAWSQNTGGNVALSLGLVLVSTFLSPVTAPLFMAGVRGITSDSFASALGHETGYFLVTVVVAPSALGVAMRRWIGDVAATRLKPTLKLLNVVVLLFLCYCNATVALPQVVAAPDWDYLVLVAVAVFGLCVTAFLSGWALAKVLRASEPDRRSLMFGLGMNNNGTGLVLAASAFGSLPWAVVPVLSYNLVQHIVAGGLARWMERPGGEA